MMVFIPRPTKPQTMKPFHLSYVCFINVNMGNFVENKQTRVTQNTWKQEMNY
jgi:hypothetical protein